MHRSLSKKTLVCPLIRAPANGGGSVVALILIIIEKRERRRE
jgi:hypothetical protein